MTACIDVGIDSVELNAMSLIEERDLGLVERSARLNNERYCDLSDAYRAVAHDILGV
jgi:hypothetical protein